MPKRFIDTLPRGETLCLTHADMSKLLNTRNVGVVAGVEFHRGYINYIKVNKTDVKQIGRAHV